MDRQTLLYNIYGDLLTGHQKDIYEAYVLQKYTLGEVADEFDISRQGVHDLVKRCNQALEGYESKLGLADKLIAVRKSAEGILNCESLDCAKEAAAKIIDIL